MLRPAILRLKPCLTISCERQATGSCDWKLRPDKPPEAPDHPYRDERIQDIRQHQLLYTRRYDGGEANEQYQVGDPIEMRVHTKAFTQNGLVHIRELHSGRVYTMDREGTAVRVPQYDVRPVRRPPEPPPLLYLPASPDPLTSPDPLASLAPSSSHEEDTDEESSDRQVD